MSSVEVFALTVGGDSVASSRVRVGSVGQVLGERRFKRLSCAGFLWPVKLMAGVARERPRRVLIQKVILPPWYLRFLKLFTRTLIFEVDDAIYLDSWRSVADGKSRTDRLRKSAHVFSYATCTSPVIEEDLRTFGFKDITVFPGPAPRINPLARGGDAVVWLGSPSTYAGYEVLLADLERAIGRPVLQCGVPPAVAAAPFRTTWSMSAQLETLVVAGIGLMPLEPGPWNDRKAAYRTLEYLAHDVVPVVSASRSVEAVFGNLADELCAVVEGSDVEAWVDGVSRARSMRDDAWRQRAAQFLMSKSAEAWTARLLK